MKKYYYSYLLCSIASIFYCYELVLRIFPSLTMQDLMKIYHLTAAEAGSVSAIYYYAYMPMQIIVGIWMDKYGPRRLLTIACFFCSMGIYLYGCGYALLAVEIGRLLMGVGSAFAFVGALKIASIWLPKNTFSLMTGLTNFLGMVGAMAGDVLVRSLIQISGWKTTTYIFCLVGLMLTFAIWFIIRDINPSQCNTKLIDTSIKSLFFDIYLLIKHNYLWLFGVVGALLYLPLSVFAELWGISYLEQARHFSTLEAIHGNALLFLGWGIGGILWGWLAFVTNRYHTLIIVGAAITLILTCVLLYISKLPVLEIDSLLFLYGVFASVEVLVFVIVREMTTVNLSGTAIALTNMIITLGGCVFQPLVGKLLDTHWLGTRMGDVRMFTFQAYQEALAVIPIGISLALVIIIYIQNTKHIRSKETVHNLGHSLRGAVL